MIINGNEFTIGADPEIFVGKDGKFVSGHGMVPGDKANPFKVDKGAVQVDGMALEFNIDPAKSFEEFDNNLTSVKNTLESMIGDKEFLDVASVKFDDEFKRNVPMENLELGCEADYNAWTGCENEPPDVNSNMRTAGGHVHIGGIFCSNPYRPVHFKTCARLARLLDFHLGTFSVLWDHDDQRRSMYGKAGCFRPKPYGMEYRTLSNKWLFRSDLRKFVFDSVELALRDMFSGFDPEDYVRGIINNSDRTSQFFVNNKRVEGLIHV